MAVFFSSDHHFNHANVIKYCGRPYKTVEEMNEDLIKRWNETVRDEDTVWYLGDFEMGKRSLDVVKRLNGKKNLIPGNHDGCFPGHKKWMKESERYHEAGFQHIFVSPQEVLLTDGEIDVYVIIWHLPYIPNPVPKDYDVRYEKWRIENKGRWLLHGHIHEKWLKRDRMINVGVDVWNGMPVSEDQILSTMKDRRDFIGRQWSTL